MTNTNARQHRDAYSLDDETKYAPDEYYSCAQALGEPACGLSNGDCRGAHAPDTYDGTPTIFDVGFGQPTTPSGIIVVQNYRPGFLIGVDLWNNATSKWVAVWRGAEANRTKTSEPRYVFVEFNASTVRTDRVQLTTSYDTYDDEIDAILLVTRLDTSPPTPQPVIH
jgi:hypothetical protein